MRLFIAFDSKIPAVDELLEAVSERQLPAGFAHVETLGLAHQLPQGHDVPSLVRGRLEEIDRLLALVDLPNANMGFELGYALGKGTLVGIAVARGAVPPWLGAAPFSAQLAAPVDHSPKRLRALAEREEGEWLQLVDPPPAGDRTLVLCPSERAEAEVVEEQLGADVLLPWADWTLRQLPKKLAGVGRVAWIVPAQTEDQVRDGAETACASVVAGYAVALGLPVQVFWHKQARPILDVFDRKATWAGLAVLGDKLRTWLEETPVGTGPAPVVDVIARWRACMRQDHRHLRLVGPETSDALLDEVSVRLHLREHQQVEGRAAHRDHVLADLLRDAAAEDAALRFVVTGEPGAGKTTIARHLVGQLAQQAQLPVPLFFRLTSLVDKAGHPFDLADRRLQAQGLEPGLLSAELRRLSGQRGRIWMCLDGLDEVGSESFGDTVDRLRDLAAAPEMAGVILVVMCRPVALAGPHQLGESFRRVDVQPLDRTQQRRLSGRLLDPTTDQRLWTELERRPALQLLVQNPLMLTLVAMVARYHCADGDELPVNRQEVYDRALSLLLTRGFGQEPVPVQSPALARRLLRGVSLALHREGGETWSDGQVEDALFVARERDETLNGRFSMVWRDHATALADIATNSGILAEHDGPAAGWRYLHRSLREFLAAEALWDGGEDVTGSLAGQGGSEAVETWGEVMALLAGLVEKPVPLIEALAAHAPDVAWRALRDADALEPAVRVPLLVDTAELFKPWQLEALVVACVASHGVEPTCRQLWALIGPGADPDRLGLVWHCLELAGQRPDRAAFFAAAGKELPGAAELPPTVPIAAGSFWMGSPDEVGDPDEHPRHKVTLSSAFRLGCTPVTVAQYRAFAEPPRGQASDQHPVVRITWFEARAYAAWLGGRLPTDAEWEYACRAGTDSAYWSGDSAEDLAEVGWFDGNSGKQVHPVATKPANPWGLHDMHGNVWEWCADDWRREYGEEPIVDPLHRVSGGEDRVIRGGSAWNDAEGCRSAFRGWWLVSSRYVFQGFRVVLPPSSAPSA